VRWNGTGPHDHVGDDPYRDISALNSDDVVWPHAIRGLAAMISFDARLERSEVSRVWIGSRHGREIAWQLLQ
jgi:hypothetical protein